MAPPPSALLLRMSLTVGAFSQTLLNGQRLQTAVKKLQATLIRSLPRLGKLLVFLLFLLNIRSWPLVWHRELPFLPTSLCLPSMHKFAYSGMFSYIELDTTSFVPECSFCLRRMASSWRTSGLNPSPQLEPIHSKRSFVIAHGQVSTVVPLNLLLKSRIGLDDCDFYFHLSNSSYGKVTRHLFFPLSTLNLVHRFWTTRV